MNALASLSLVTANCGNGKTFSTVLQDWNNFLGGRPAETVVVDCSDISTQGILFDLYVAGKIDKLQFVQNTLPETGKSHCFIREHLCAASATKPYILWFKPDTLPFQSGHSAWLDEDISQLDRSNVFCVSGSFNKDVRIADDGPIYYRAQHASINFCLMKHQRFAEAMDLFANAYISSGFCGNNPGDEHGVGRFLIEAAFRHYMLKNEQFCLTRYENDEWSVFHTNVSDEKLLAARERYYRRDGVRPYFNARNFQCHHGGVYYGQRFGGRFHEMRSRFGRQAIKKKLASVFGRPIPKISPLAQ